MIFTTIIVGVLLILGSIIMLPERWAPSLYPTYIETIEANWNLSLPIPDSEKDIYSSRVDFHGDGEAITELLYDKPMDIQKIKDLSNNWVSGEEFNITELPTGVQELIREIDKSSSYFYLQDSYNFIFFELNGNKLTIYESYI
ncbi:hypothetical protein ACQKL5_19725 [Peribacillus sp. NPDC097675]|uniref:hypothetical protein n=1 Tax=Peribacillus sp. NPDC097675 TaxID=3390618 RepID=UPI003CFC7AE6